MESKRKADPSRIKNPLPRPTACDCCGGTNIALEENNVLYGRNYGSWPLCWFCYDCEALVGCHPGTDIPMGRMADQVTRQWRRKAHEVFDPLWKRTTWSRGKAYGWLAEQLGLHPTECHISWFDATTCQRAIEIIKKRKG